MVRVAHAPLPATGKYYIATMTMITASTALTIFIMNIHHCGPGARPVPRWAKTIILQHMARLFFVYEVGESCKSPRQEPEPVPRGQMANGGAAQEDPPGKASPVGDGLPPGSPPSQGPCTPPEQAARSGQQAEPGDGGCGGPEPPAGARSQCRCPHSSILQHVEYIASCFRDQKAASKRTGEWKKVAKVMDRFFMWVFFAMVFVMSVLIMGQAI